MEERGKFALRKKHLFLVLMKSAEAKSTGKAEISDD
jgi:hypothetical protein